MLHRPTIQVCKQPCTAILKVRRHPQARWLLTPRSLQLSLFLCQPKTVRILDTNVRTMEKNMKLYQTPVRRLVRSYKPRRLHTSYIFMSRHQNVGKKHNMKAANKSFENVSKLKYLGTWKRIKITFKKKIRHKNRGMFDTMQFGILSLPFQT